MSIQRTDVNEYVTGVHVVGNDSLGVIGSLIPTTGSDGGSIFTDDLSPPTTDSIEFRALITSAPATGELYLYENGAFTFEPDGQDTESFIVDMYQDGVFQRSETVNIETNTEQRTSSTINLSITGITDGLHRVVIVDNSTTPATVIHDDDVSFTSEAGAIPTIPLAVGVRWFGLWFGDNAPTDGSGITGVTV